MEITLQWDIYMYIHRGYLGRKENEPETPVVNKLFHPFGGY